MIGNIKTLSERHGMPSVPTIRKLIARHADFPIIRRGKPGIDYQIDLAAAEAFIRRLREAPVMEAAQRRALIQELGLTLISMEGKADD